MIDLWALAQQTTAWLAGNTAVSAVSIGVARAVGGDIWKLVKSKCQVAGNEEALAEFEAQPEDPGSRAALQGALHKLLKADPDFAHQLHELLGKQAQAGGHTQSIIQGDHGKATMSIGDGNKIEIH